MSIIYYVTLYDVNQRSVSVGFYDSYTSAQRLKPVSNPDLWEYNPEELVRLRRFSSSTVLVQTHPLSGLIAKVHTSKEYADKA